MKRCRQCSASMPDDVRFCMACGSAMRAKPVSLIGGGLLASLANGFSLAPLVTMGIENGAGTDPQTIRKTTSAHIRPLPDGTWYCPDCGTLNPRFASFCSGCARDAL